MKKYSSFILIPFLFVVTFLFLQIFSAYHFYYIEQFQLFLTTPACFFEGISHPGGLTEYFSHFLVQFFIVPYCGALIETIILIAVFLAASRFVLRSEKSKVFFIIPASIYLSCLLMCFNFNVFFQGTLSFLLCLICLNIYALVKKSLVQIVLVYITVPLLYWFAGSVSLLFAFCFTASELLNEKSKRRLAWLTLPIWALLVSWFAVRFSLVANYRVSFLPDMYYQTKLSPSFNIYFPWILMLIWISVTTYLSKVQLSQKKVYWILGIQVMLFIFLFGQGVIRYGDRDSYQVKKMDYYCRTEQWDKIIAESKKKEIKNYLHLNYLNLALAEKGFLSGSMFGYNQKGPLSLEVSSQKKNVLSALMSDISFAVGDIAAAQRYAFEGYETCSGNGSGRLLKRLIQTNLIYGEYAVAEKYIQILEHTLFYRKWAISQRKFLCNDSACMNDALIATKRKCLPPSGSRAISGGFPQTLKTLVEINKENKIARDYLLAFCLLTKDLKEFKNIFERYCPNEIKSGNLPVIYQQAVLMYYESQPEKWKIFGVSPETISQYKQYKYTFLRNRQDSGIKIIMHQQFASTYWFYFQFI